MMCRPRPLAYASFGHYPSGRTLKPKKATAAGAGGQGRGGPLRAPTATPAYKPKLMLYRRRLKAQSEAAPDAPEPLAPVPTERRKGGDRRTAGECLARPAGLEPATF